MQPGRPRAQRQQAATNGRRLSARRTAGHPLLTAAHAGCYRHARPAVLHARAPTCAPGGLEAPGRQRQNCGQGPRGGVHGALAEVAVVRQHLPTQHPLCCSALQSALVQDAQRIVVQLSELDQQREEGSARCPLQTLASDDRAMQQALALCKVGSGNSTVCRTAKHTNDKKDQYLVSTSSVCSALTAT